MGLWLGQVCVDGIVARQCCMCAMGSCWVHVAMATTVLCLLTAGGSGLALKGLGCFCTIPYHILHGGWHAALPKHGTMLI